VAGRQRTIFVHCHHRLIEIVHFAVTISLLCALCAALAAPAQARRPAPVAAGDTLITRDGTRCTLGYVYRVPRHTMGVGAGHCASTDGSPISNIEARVQGTTVSASFLADSDTSLPQKDWWLIDFGDVAWSDHIVNTVYRVVTYVNARESDWVCHYGVGSSTEICGFVSNVAGPLITVTQTGWPGDSGGPTYIKINNTAVAVVGLWQGHFNDPRPGGGYVMSLPAALAYFRGNAS
jgi:hypothetical protein